MGSSDSTSADIAAFRLTMFEELGFTPEQADALLWVNGVGGFLLNHHDVKAYLKAGCSHDKIVDVFA